MFYHIMDEAILYFSDKDKAENYMKNISIMIIEKLRFNNFPQKYNLVCTKSGYRIDKCVWDIFIPVYTKFSEITLTPIFEI